MGERYCPFDERLLISNRVLNRINKGLDSIFINKFIVLDAGIYRRYSEKPLGLQPAQGGGLANFIKVLVKGTNCYVNITRLSF